MVASIAESIAPGGHAAVKGGTVAVGGDIRRKHAGHQAGSRGDADRTETVGVIKANAARRKPVEIRRLDQRVPIPAHDLPVMFVRADEYDVWRVLPVIHLPRRSGFRQNCSGPGCDSFTELSSSDSRHFRFCAIPCNPRRKDGPVCNVFIPNQSCASRWYWTLTQRVKICQHAAKFEIQNRWST